ncbi:MAG: YbhB/YbcL family Raf kinase inhibitor-like protein [Candidatus Magasanikbacteria bacterium]|nr:YbhB/YbcL family Raf kinase inhibitor-like protein [Candidatus Magasanikbacteria bacterium]
MQLTSPAFVNNEKIPAKYTCDGENIAPELNVSGVPVEAESLALIVDDPDAPMGALRPGSGQAWDHWLVYNISPSSASIAENSVPDGGIQVTNSFGRKTYGGPCPPSGVHHYRFKLYALDAKLELGISSKKGLEEAMKNHLLAQTELVGLYAR